MSAGQNPSGTANPPVTSVSDGGRWRPVRRTIAAAFVAAVLPSVAAAAPITPTTYSFSGTLTEVTATMDLWMPELTEGMSFWGTMSITPYLDSDVISSAELRLQAGSQIVTASSFGLDPLASFANYTPVGPLYSPTIQDAVISNVFFSLTTLGPSMGSVGFYVMGRDPQTGVVKADHVFGDIRSVAVPEPVSGTLMLMGVGAAAAFRRRCTVSCRT
jgi:hypothetical protein